jgi:hypothetical protein
MIREGMNGVHFECMVKMRRRFIVFDLCFRKLEISVTYIRNILEFQIFIGP